MYSTEQFIFKKQSKVLYGFCPDLGMKNFPDSFTVVSAHTGTEVKFVYDSDAAEQNEWWDGEMAQYRPLGDVPNCRAAVLYPYTEEQVGF